MNDGRPNLALINFQTLPSNASFYGLALRDSTGRSSIKYDVLECQTPASGFARIPSISTGLKKVQMICRKGFSGLMVRATASCSTE
jgi:hypothetical protein